MVGQKRGPTMVESVDPREREQEPIEATGRNVDEAIRRGLSELGLTREQVEIEVLSEGRPGILGVGAQPARVRLAPRAQPSPAQQTAPTPAPAAEAPAPAPARPRRAPRTAASAAATSEPTAETLDDDFVRQGAGTPGKALTLDLDLVTESAVDTLE